MICLDLLTTGKFLYTYFRSIILFLDIFQIFLPLVALKSVGCGGGGGGGKGRGSKGKAGKKRVESRNLKVAGGGEI